MISDSEHHLEKAFNSAKSAIVHEANRAHLDIYDSAFNLSDLLICHFAAREGEFPQPFNLEDFTDLVRRRFKANQGPQLLELLADIRRNYLRRNGCQKYDQNVLVMASLWTYSDLPLWMLSSQTIATVVREYIGGDDPPPKVPLINSAIKRSGLIRLDQTANKALYSAEADSELQ